MEYNYKEIEYY